MLAPWTLNQAAIDSMGDMGAMAPTTKMMWGQCPKSPLRNFVIVII